MTKSSVFSPVLIAGCAVLMLSFALRASFGVFQIPIAAEFGWARSDFSMAIAIQNLAWGLGQPIFGALAERFGDRRAIIAGALMYALGLLLSGYASTPGTMQLLEILVGFGIAGTGFGVILAIVGRASSPENRSMALGIATAAGSMGQVIGAPGPLPLPIVARQRGHDVANQAGVHGGIGVDHLHLVEPQPQPQAGAEHEPHLV